MTANIHRRIIPHKDYDKEQNKWIPCESCTEFIIEIGNADICIECSDKKTMDKVYSLLSDGDIIIHNERSYCRYLDKHCW